VNLPQSDSEIKYCCDTNLDDSFKQYMTDKSITDN